MASKFKLIGSGASARPVPAKMYRQIKLICDASGATISSALRTSAAVSYARSRGAALQSQPELWEAYQNGTGAPANPPGYSTHERRSDGVAYPRVTRGLPLPAWGVGLDVGTVSGQDFCNAARAYGWIATVTYSTESWHVNFRKKPKFSIWRIRPLKRGSRGPRVIKLKRRLKYLGYFDNSTSKPGFGGDLHQAVQVFQSDHGLGNDGVVGIHTWRQIQHSFRDKRKKNR